MSMYQDYKVISLNVNGLHNPVKRSKVIAKMKRESLQVIFWQETHLSDAEHEKLKKMGFMNTFYSSHKSGRKRGVAILLPNKINFQLTAEIKDREGRFILIRGKIDHKEVTLLNVYMPPGQDRSLHQKIFNLLVQEASGIVICGGDWNVQLQPKLDSTNLHKGKNGNSLIMRKLLKESGMIDVWRDLHPSEKHFTYYSSCHKEYSRLDYFFMYTVDRHRIRACKIGIQNVSDHSGVYLTLHLDNKKKDSLWRLNPSLMNEKVCKEFIRKELEESLLSSMTMEQFHQMFCGILGKR